MSRMRARELRNSMPREEVRLWARLKRLRERGFHIRRQAPIRGYYLDFVCFSRRLVIELDGSQHAEDGRKAHDEVRDAVLKREGFQILRFWNHFVREDIDTVMDVIIAALEAAPDRLDQRVGRTSPP
ncbi:endonuclease domain-containing protein [Phenylobacterium sp.]|uniref:endonuclease domain-containing protein n=1 Tax=Phenylobacterium sp. TaxID=1871053 RepID=UPI002FC81036